MPTYRLYRLDGAGRIVNAEWIEAADDDTVRAQARAESTSAGHEIWDRDRLVERVSPFATPPGSAAAPA